MKKRTLGILAALLMFVTLFPSGAYTADAQTSEIVVTPTFGQTDARSMLDMINAFRTGDEAFCWNESDTAQVSYKGEALSYSYALEEIAMQRAAEVALSFSHTRPDNTRCFTATASDGTRSWGENIAAGSSTASGAFTQWREDNENYAGQGHRRNMLSGRFCAIGIGHVYFNGYHYWVQEFSDSLDSAAATAALDTERATSINVSAARLASAGDVTVSADSVTLNVGERAALPTVSASVQVSDAWPGQATTVSVKPVWTSGNASVCAVDGQELVGVAAGSATITGAALGKSVSVAVTVGGGSGGSGSGDNGGGSGSGDNGGVYAILYEDGTLVFQYGDATDGRAVKKTYPVDLTVGYTWEWDDDIERLNTPWYNECESIRVVLFADKIGPTSTACWFCDCVNLERVDNIRNLNTANVTNMSAMFGGCSGLVELDVSNFSTANVTDMSGAFGGCSGLTALDVSHFDTSNVTDMQGMFGACSSLTELDVSHFDTSNVNIMFGMFDGCSKLTTLDLSSFDTAKVTNMGQMFANSGLTALDLSHFDTSNVNHMRHMFYACNGLTALDLSHWNVANVTNMSYMFQNCSALTVLDLSYFDTANVKDMSFMFDGCSNLNTIYTSDKFTTTSINKDYGYNEIFSDCVSLVGGNGTKYDENYTDVEYARIDTPSTPGYFTDKSTAPVAYAIIAAVTDEEGNLSVTLTNPDAATLAAAYFDANGRFVSVTLQSVGANAGTVALELASGAVKARVMLFDGDSRPLCAAYPVTL